MELVMEPSRYCRVAYRSRHIRKDSDMFPRIRVSIAMTLFAISISLLTATGCSDLKPFMQRAREFLAGEFRTGVQQPSVIVNVTDATNSVVIPTGAE